MYCLRLGHSFATLLLQLLIKIYSQYSPMVLIRSATILNKIDYKDVVAAIVDPFEEMMRKNYESVKFRIPGLGYAKIAKRNLNESRHLY